MSTKFRLNIVLYVFQRNERREREQRELAKQALQAQKCEYSDNMSSFDGSRSSVSSESDSYTNGTQVLPLHRRLIVAAGSENLE
jgi:hypothetical protein